MARGQSGRLQARRFAAAEALGAVAASGALQGRHPPACRGLRARGRLPGRAGARHHLRHPRVGLPDRRPRAATTASSPSTIAATAEARCPPAAAATASTAWPATSTPCSRRRWRRGSAPSSPAIRWAASRSPRGRSAIPTGVTARRRGRADQHHDRRSAAPRAVPSGAAAAGRGQGACGGHTAENVRRGAAAACGGYARAGGSCRRSRWAATPTPRSSTSSSNCSTSTPPAGRGGWARALVDSLGHTSTSG